MLVMQHSHGDIAVDQRVSAQVHDARAAPTKLALDDIATDLLTNEIHGRGW